MQCTPSGWSKPAAHGLKKLYIENKLQIVPHSLQMGRMSMPLSLPREPEQTFTQWTVHTKGIGLFTTNYLIHNNP